MSRLRCLLATVAISAAAHAQPAPAAPSASAPSPWASAQPGAPAASAPAPASSLQAAGGARRYVEPTEPARTQGDDIEEKYLDTPFVAPRWVVFPALAGIVLLGAEVKLLPQLSVLGYVAGGAVNTFRVETNNYRRQAYGELQAALRFYPVGTMSGGIYVAADATYILVNTGQLIPTPLMDVGAGLATGLNLGSQFRTFYGVMLDLALVGRYRAYQPSFSVPTTDAEGKPLAQVGRPGKWQFGFALAIGYLF